MIENTITKKTLGIIPARGGSKGIPDKNIRLLGDKPLIAYTIDAAKRSKLLTDFVVSTDSEKIANVCKNYGLEVPFMRPIELSGDYVESYPVIVHALKKMEESRKESYDYFVMLQPTSPVREAEDIDNSLKILFETETDSVVSVVDAGASHPLRMKRIVGDNILITYIDQGFENMKPRQELPPVYIRNGAVYASRFNVLEDVGALVGKNCRAYIMPPERSINIDSMVDFRVAEAIIEQNVKNNNRERLINGC